MQTRSLTEIRRDLHRLAELSGEESSTAAYVEQTLRSFGHGDIRTGMGGHGVACVIRGKQAGPRLLYRCDLDALPLTDDPALPHASVRKEAAHRCGHDGHMALALGLAQHWQRNPLARGEVVLLFQPAEETGAGAEAVLADPVLPNWSPIACSRCTTCRACRWVASFCAKASSPAPRAAWASTYWAEAATRRTPCGEQPLAAAAELALALAGLPTQVLGLGENALVTLVGLQSGGENYGTCPGKAMVAATLRAHREETMQSLVRAAIQRAGGIASAHGVQAQIRWQDIFPATPCDPTIVGILRESAQRQGFQVIEPALPLPGPKTSATSPPAGPVRSSAWVRASPSPLHADGYDFPDDLLVPGLRFLIHAIPALLQQGPAHAHSRILLD
ncbi:MAG: M20/M25/M40 family metallo-hydrolase [Planctomycetota bacterium]